MGFAGTREIGRASVVLSVSVFKLRLQEHRRGTGARLQRLLKMSLHDLRSLLMHAGAGTAGRAGRAG